DLGHAAQMVSGKESSGTAHLLSHRKRSTCDRHAVRCAFFTDLAVAPQHVRIALNDVVLLLDLPSTPLQPVVGVLAAMRADGDGEELIAGVPFEGARAV